VSPGLLAARPFTLAAVYPSKTGVNALSDPAVFALLRHMKSPANGGQAARGRGQSALGRRL